MRDTCKKRAGRQSRPAVGANAPTALPLGQKTPVALRATGVTAYSVGATGVTAATAAATAASAAASSCATCAALAGLAVAGQNAGGNACATCTSVASRLAVTAASTPCCCA